MDKKYKEEKMSAEEVEQELRRIQLYRERIGLQKEIARQEMKSKVSSAMEASSSILLIFFRGILNIIIRFARFLQRISIHLVVTICAVSVFAGYYKNSKHNFLRDRTEHVDTTCGYYSDPYTYYKDYGEEAYKKKYGCRKDEYDIFTKKHKPFLYFED